MKNSYTQYHYNTKLRPYTKFDVKFVNMIAEKYLKSKSGKLLDVCCGRGRHIELFTEIGFDCYGVDQDSTAKDKGLNVKVYDVEYGLPFEDSSFDFVILNSCIEHIRNTYKLIEESYRVLRKGGKIFIITTDWKFCHKIFYLDVDHVSPFMKCSLNDLLIRYDFNDVDVKYFYFLPYTWNSKIGRFVAWFIAHTLIFDFSPSCRLNWWVKQVKFAREKCIVGVGVK